MDIQTETYLEVISDRPPEEEAGVQTEAALDRPPAPLYVPKPAGVDTATQIAPGELFDFDMEVVPLLEVLVGRTLEQALAEVAQAREISALRARREEFQAVRAAEQAEVARLEAEARRRFAEKQRRKEQEVARLQRETAVREKVAAAAFARSYLATLRRNVFATLHQTGHFYEPLRRSMEAEVLPEVLRAVGERTADRGAAVALLEELLARAAVLAGEKRDAFVQWQAEEETKRKAEEEERKRREAEEAAAKAAAEAASGEEAPAEE